MRVYFKGLGELRGVAAMGVVWHHIELYKYRNDVGSLFNTPALGFIEGLGKNGVYLFFVLSGFLITYLLLSEIRLTGDVAIRKFYIRRILRIWPLYYSIVILSFFLLPWAANSFSLGADSYYGSLIARLHENFGERLILFLLFLPNLALIVFLPVAGASQSWSVGVEEQFYLIWPQVLVRFRKHIVPILIGIIVMKFGLYFGLTILNGAMKNEVLKVAVSFLRSFNIELMALGGIGAYYCIEGRLDKIYEKLPRFVRWVLLAVIAMALWIGINTLLLGGLFLVLILLNIDDRHSVFRNSLFSFLGDISYGIYMYHPIMMFLSYSLVERFLGVQNLMLLNVLFYTLTISLTILVSYLSFRYLERYFLRWKDEFVIFPSGKPLENG